MKKLIIALFCLASLSAMSQPSISIPGNNSPRYSFNQLFRYYGGSFHSVLDKDSIPKANITFTSGLWQASPIAVAYGGTGLTTLGSALQSIRVNSAGTALEYYTPSSGGVGSVTNFVFTNGNGFTGTVTNSTTTPTLSLVLQDAGASQSGQVNTAAQTFGGLKTFQGGIIVNNSTVSANQLTIGTGSGGYGWLYANAGSPVTRVDLRGYFGGALLVNFSTTSFSYFNTGARFAFGSNTDNGTDALQVTGSVRSTSTIKAANYYSTSTAPTISAGANIGTGGTVSIVGTNQDGIITVNTGTDATTGVLCTITMSGSFAYPTSCTPVITHYSGPMITGDVTVDTPTSTSWGIYMNGGVVSSSTYKWTYHNGGY